MQQNSYGRAIGSYLGKTIFESISEGEGGRKYVFDRIADSDDEGIPLTQLKSDEVLFAPGLIYRQA